MRRFLLLISLALTGPPTAVAQFRTGTPEAALASALSADSAHDWLRLLGLTVPASLTKLRDQQVEVLRDTDMMGSFGGQLDSCAVRIQRQYTKFRLDSVFRVPSFDSLARSRPDSVFARAHRF